MGFSRRQRERCEMGARPECKVPSTEVQMPSRKGNVYLRTRKRSRRVAAGFPICQFELVPNRQVGNLATATSYRLLADLQRLKHSATGEFQVGRGDRK